MPEHVFGDGPAGAPGAMPFAEDALRLVSSIQDFAKGWAERNLGEANGPHVPSDCQWCPLCQFVAVLRGERPEVTDRIVEVGAAIAAAVRVMAEAAAGTPSPHHDPTGPDAHRVQKINLSDEA